METRQQTLDGEITTPYTDEPLLRELYEKQEKSIQDIADELECSIHTIYRSLDRCDIRSQDRENTTPAPFYTRTDGYEYWMDDGQGVLVHRLVAVAVWGFETVSNSEAIHHRNTHRWDNRPENLMPCETHAKHMREHARPKAEDDQGTLNSYPTTDQPIAIENGHRDPNQLTFDDF